MSAVSIGSDILAQIVLLRILVSRSRARDVDAFPDLKSSKYFLGLTCSDIVHELLDVVLPVQLLHDGIDLPVTGRISICMTS